MLRTAVSAHSAGALAALRRALKRPSSRVWARQYTTSSYHPQVGVERIEKDLKAVFDGASAPLINDARIAGLLNIPQLTHPSGFQELAKQCRANCEKKVTELLREHAALLQLLESEGVDLNQPSHGGQNHVEIPHVADHVARADRHAHTFSSTAAQGDASTPSARTPVAHAYERATSGKEGWATDVRTRMIHVLRRLDEISNELCRILDMSDFVRHSHPDTRFSAAAHDTCVSLSQYMEELNTKPELYKAVVDVTRTPEYAMLDEESQRNAENFISDFELSGIHLDEATRAKVVEQIALTDALRAQYEEGVAGVGGSLRVSAKAMQGFNAGDLSIFQRDREDVIIDCASPAYRDWVLYKTSNPALREQVLRTSFAHCQSQLSTLHKLLVERQRLAEIVEQPTYAHKVLQGSMAQTPERVKEFLHLVNQRLKPRALKIVQRLQQDKIREHGDSVFRNSDVLYYTSRHRERGNAAEAALSKFLSLGNCMAGLALLTDRLFGVTMEVCETGRGEVWHDSVQKVQLRSEKEGVLGTLYCDLFRRQGKMPQAAHFTIQGSRTEYSEGPSQTVDDEHVLAKQRPIIALNCGLPTATPAHMSFAEAETLFHEFGHALHSLLCRSNYQNVSGTRCSFDFVEFPSSLFQLFMTDYRVVSTFAVDNTGKPVSEELFNQVVNSRHQFHALDMESTLLLSAVDIELHSCGFNDTSDSNQIVQEVQNEFGVLPADGLPIHTKFHHLGGYAASYYSYLWCQV